MATTDKDVICSSFYHININHRHLQPNKHVTWFLVRTVTFVIATLASSVTLQFVGRQSLINLETTGVGRLRSSGLSAILRPDFGNQCTSIQIIPISVPMVLSGWWSPECCSYSKQNIEVWFGYRLSDNMTDNMTDNTTTNTHGILWLICYITLLYRSDILWCYATN